LHASNAVDAIQRFIGKIELGMIPQIIDTVIFIQNGKLSKVYELKMTVKVPSGMMAADLARPVVNINDFETGKLEYEIYAYGEEAVVIPVLEIVKSEHNLLQLIEKKFSRISKKIKVESVNEKSLKIFVPKKTALEFEAELDKEVKSIEKEYDINIQIEKTVPQGEKILFELKAETRHITISPEKETIGKEADIYSDGEFVLRAKVGKKNIIRLDAESDQGKQILTAIKAGKEIEIRV
jgi:ATPase